MYKGVTNIGIRPTIDDGTYVTVETFVLDFDEDVYDSDVIIRLKNLYVLNRNLIRLTD